jgi:transcription elongation factor GreA
MAGQVYLTREGYQKLVSQLESLKTTERHRISKAIGEARAQGDISENAEYDAAKDAQAHNEARIADMEGTLSNVVFIEDMNIPTDKIFIGAPEEVEFGDDRLSVFSPIGKGLLTHAPGDEVSIQVPAGVKRFKVLSLKR